MVRKAMGIAVLVVGLFLTPGGSSTAEGWQYGPDYPPLDPCEAGSVSVDCTEGYDWAWRTATNRQHTFDSSSSITLRIYDQVFPGGDVIFKVWDGDGAAHLCVDECTVEGPATVSVYPGDFTPIELYQAALSAHEYPIRGVVYASW